MSTTQAILQTIDGELAELETARDRLIVLRRLTERMGEEGDVEISLDGSLLYGSNGTIGDGAAPKPKAEPKSIPPPVRESPPSGPRRAKAKDAIRREGAADRKVRSGGTELQEKVVELIRAEPGLNGLEIGKRLGIDNSTASGRLVSLCRSGRVRREQDGSSKRYYPSQHDVAPSDVDGAKTGPERKIVEALKASPVALTSREIQLNSGVHEVAAIAAGLCRRGVLERENGAGEVVRFKVARKAAA